MNVQKTIQISTVLNDKGFVEFDSGLIFYGWNRIDSVVLNLTNGSLNNQISTVFSFSTNAIVFESLDGIWSTRNVAATDNFVIKIGINFSLVAPVQVNSIKFIGNFEQDIFDRQNYLADYPNLGFFVDNELYNKNWRNLLQKCVDKGVLPEFIQRFDSENDAPIQDFFAYWTTICKFYAIFTVLGVQKIEQIFLQKQSLFKFLTEKTFLLNFDNSLQILQQIAVSSYPNFQKRGTHNIHADINGELLLFLGKKHRDEFLFEFLPRHLSGWTTDSPTCPVYMGNTGRPQLNKSPNKLKNFTLDDLSGFNLYGGDENVLVEFNEGEFFLITEDGDFLITEDGEMVIVNFDTPRDVLLIKPSPNSLITENTFLTEELGEIIILEENIPNQLNALLLEEDEDDDSVVIEGSGVGFETFVHTSLGYELTFWFKQSQSDEGCLSVIFASENAQRKTSLQVNSRILPAKFNGVYSLKHTQIVNNQLYYFVRCIVFDVNFDSTFHNTTNIGVGNNLVFNERDTDLLKIYVLNQSQNTYLRIWDLKLTPLNLQSNSVFLDQYNLNNIVCVNRNVSVDEQNIKQKITNYLLPYNTVLNFQNLKFLEQLTNQSYLNTEQYERLNSEDNQNITISNG